MPELAQSQKLRNKCNAWNRLQDAIPKVLDDLIPRLDELKGKKIIKADCTFTKEFSDKIYDRLRELGKELDCTMYFEKRTMSIWLGFKVSYKVSEYLDGSGGACDYIVESVCIADREDQILVSVRGPWIKPDKVCPDDIQNKLNRLKELKKEYEEKMMEIRDTLPFQFRPSLNR